MQGVVVFLHLSLRDLAELISDRVVTDECYEAIVDAVRPAAYRLLCVDGDSAA